jgi:cell division protein FtsL
MSGESFEWAIKKDIRNNPIVREVDLERHRDMWRSVGVGVFLVLALLSFAWRQAQFRDYGFRTEAVRKHLAEETITQRHLRMEVETYRSPTYVEPVAINELKMIHPGAEDAILIERIVDPPAPPQSAVASR